MSKDIGDLAHDLVEETLSETADTFFGTRKRLEDSIEIFGKKIDKLDAVQTRILKVAGDLHYLLLQGEAAPDFYEKINVDPSSFLKAVDPDCRTGSLKSAKALTSSGKYAKTVLRAYKRFQEAADVYMNGKYITDDEGRKHLSLHYNQLMSWCSDLNEHIQKVNREVSPSDTLAFIKKLDTVNAEKAKFTGGGGGGSYENNLDREMAFRRIECENIDLIAFPDMPPADEISSRLKGFCKSLAGENKERVKSLMNSL